MSVFGSIFQWFFSLFSMTFKIFGYKVSFWLIFVFLCVAGVSAFILHAILH